MSGIDNLHSKTKMLLVEEHLNLLSAQYLVGCLDTDNVCHHITTMDHPPREMKETLVLFLLGRFITINQQRIYTNIIIIIIYLKSNIQCI